MQNYYNAYDETGKEYVFETKIQGNSISLTLKKELFESAKTLYVLGDYTKAVSGDDGYYIIPRNIGQKGDIQTFFTVRDNTEFDLLKPIMGFCGIKKKDMCCIIRVERNYNFVFRVDVKDGIYQLSVIFNFEKQTARDVLPDFVYDDIRIEIVMLPTESDYNTMAVTERNIRLERGEITTLTEKCKRSAVEYARKYPLIRIRMGWKPSPSPVLHQTPENEPEMHVACTFLRVCEIAHELKRQGVEGAELQLVGWNIGGHDGRFSQLFPADLRLGGNEGLKKTIEYVKSLGYRISTHTNTIDSVEISDIFDFGEIIIRPDGGYQQVGHYSGGLAYHVCAIHRNKIAKRNLPELAQYGENGLHFTDVDSITIPEVCYSEDHKSSTGEGIAYINDSIEYTSKLFGGFSSEGCMDFTMKYLDYGLYVTFGDSFGKKECPIADRYLPVWEVAYHGTMLYNPASPTINYPIKTPEDKLTFIMRGGRPSLYIYSKFRTGGHVNWMGETDLVCTTDAQMEQTVGYIKQALDEYSPLADKQLVFMDGYDILGDGIERARYSDGCEIIGNFRNCEKIYDGTTLKPYGYIVRE